MKGKVARKRATTATASGIVTTGPADGRHSPVLYQESSGGSSSSTSSPSGVSSSPATHYQHRHHKSDDNLSDNSSSSDEEGLSFLPLLSPSGAPSCDIHGNCHHCKKQSLPTLHCLRSMLCRPRTSKQKTQFCSLAFLALIFTIFVIEKMVFAVRFVTMGRPAILYGSPMEWNDVKGCLSTSYKQELVDYMREAKTNRASMPLNENIVWNWHRYSQNSNQTASIRNAPKRKVLIAQYSGFGSYSKILQEVEPVNRAYAKKWGHDYVTLQGTALHFPGLSYENSTTEHDDTRKCPNLQSGYEAQSTFNKIPLLIKALEMSKRADANENSNQHYYDQVLILDTDTMIVNLDFDISRLLVRSSHEYFLAAYRVWWNDWHWTWDVNAGITLWNLHHPTTQQVAHDWLQRSLTHPKDVLLKNDDQFFLQRALMSLGWWTRMRYAVRTVRDEFEYYDATLIKHFKRDARSWSRTSLEQRLLRIQEAKAVVCAQWKEDCAAIEQEMEAAVSLDD